MINNIGKSIQERIAEMVETNLKVSEQILQTTLKIKKYILWLKIMNIVKVLLVVIPLILGFLFLSPYLKSMQSAFSTYGELLGIDNSSNNKASQNINGDSPQDVLQQIEELKKNGTLDKLLSQ